MTVEEIVVKLGFKAETAKVKDFAKAIGDIPLSVAAAIGALAGIDFSLMMMTKNALNAAQGFSLFTAETGLSAKQLQKWQLVAKQIGLDESVVTSSVRGIQNTIAQIRLGHGELLMGFGKLGIDIRGKNPFQILEQLRGRVGKYDPGVAAQLLQSIGVSPDMLALLRMPRGKFESMANAGGGMTDEQIKAFSDLKTIITTLGLTIEHDFYPALQAAVPLLKDFALVLTDIARTLGAWLPTMIKVFGHLPGMELMRGKAFDDLMMLGLKADVAYQHVSAQPAGGARMGGGLNLQQYIYSTASPEEVAEHSIREMRRHTTRVAKQFGNTGY